MPTDLGATDEPHWTPTDIPAAPEGITATAGAGYVILSWTPVDDAIRYNVYRATTPGVNKENGLAATAATNWHIDSGVFGGFTYYWVVTAANAAGESPESVEVVATPDFESLLPAPTGVSAIAGDVEVNITWDAVTEASGYSVYWSTTPGVDVTSGTHLTVLGSWLLHRGLTNGTTYYYVVAGYNYYLRGMVSAEVSATPEAPSGSTGE